MNVDLLRVLLVCLLAVPSIAAVVVALLGPRRSNAIRWISLGAMLFNLLLAIVLAAGLVSLRSRPADEKKTTASTATGDASVPTFKPEIVPGAAENTGGARHRTTWHLLDFGELGSVDFYLGLDGLNIWLVVLTTLLMVSGVLISWVSITDRVNEYYAWLLLLGTAMLGVFVSFDIVLFYIFFELTLVPLFFLIGIWGGPERRTAARKFFIYTLTGSLITLLGVLAAVVVVYDHPLPGAARKLTFAIPELVSAINYHLRHASTAEDLAFWHSFEFWVFLALTAGFAIKVPLFPLHTWLPLAHVEAPTAGSVLLAGVLLKVGSYGFLRLCLPLAPGACWTVGLPLIGTLAVIGIIYGALCSLAQDDIKKLVAYSSVSHMGFCMLGMFALNPVGLTGSLLQMLNHGLSTGALFLLVGMLYDRYHTRRIADYGGMGARLGLLTVCWVFIVLTSIGLPGLNGFVGEAMVFFGMFQAHAIFAVLGTAGIVLGAWYLLMLLRRVFFGPVKEPPHDGHHPITDINLREWAALAPIMVLCVALGVYPQPAIDTARPDLEVVSKLVQQRQPLSEASRQEGSEQPVQASRRNNADGR
jgi:NADH-quinone oxidoreductase subunit M